MTKSMEMGCIYVRLAGGLGNQMFQYAAGRALSLDGNRSLYLDTTLIQRDPKRSYALSCFNVVARVDESPRLPGRYVAPLPGMGIAGKLIGGRLRLGNTTLMWDRETGHDPRLGMARGSLVMTGYWQSPQYFSTHESTLRKDFTFRNAATDASEVWLERIAGVTSVGVHVRRGDYATEPGTLAVHGLCSPMYYNAAASMMRERHGNAEFFVLSDDPDWAGQNLDLGGPTHLVGHPAGTPDHEDMRLLAACRHIITANSSFSWWGAWLGAGGHGGTVICPKRWFAGRPEIPGLIPDDWMRI